MDAAEEPSQLDDIKLSSLHEGRPELRQSPCRDESSIAQTSRSSDVVSFSFESTTKAQADVRAQEQLGPQYIRSHTFRQRIDWRFICIHVATKVLVLALLGFISFMWSASLNNFVWHKIMVKG